MINFNGTTLTEVHYNGVDLDSVWFCDSTAGTCTEVFSKPRVYIKLNSASCTNSYCYISDETCQLFEGTFRDVYGSPVGCYSYSSDGAQYTYDYALCIFNTDDIKVGYANIDYCSNVSFTFTPSVTDYTRCICMFGCGRTLDVVHWPSYVDSHIARGFGENISLPAKTTTTNCTIYPTALDVEDECQTSVGGSILSPLGTVCIWLTDMSVSYDSVNITACGVTCNVSMTDLRNGVTLYFSNN